MNTKTSKTDFLDSINKLLLKDTKPKLPALDDPRWNEYFASTFDERRETLSQAWFHCAHIQSNKGRGQPISNIGDIFYNNREWLQKLQPYVRSSHVWQENFHLKNLHFAHIFAGEPCADEPSQTIRSLWFGTEEEKLNTLRDGPTDRRLIDVLMYGKAFIAQLAWKAAALPQGTSEHKTAACLYSYWTGFTFGDPKMEPSEEAWAWHMLGNYTKGGDQFNPHSKRNPEQSAYFETTKDIPQLVHKILKDSDVNALANIFPTVFDYAQKKPKTQLTTTNSLLGNVCPPESTAHGALACWMPQHAGPIQMAELSGMSLEETLAIVKNLTISQNVSTPALPDDFSSNLGL